MHDETALLQTRPLTPDTKLIGPVMASPPKPLPVDLERFVAGAGSRGVVIVSMGTHAKLGARPLVVPSCPAVPTHPASQFK